MLNDQFMKTFYWYNRIDVQYELVKQTYLREFSLLVPSWISDPLQKRTSTRNLKCHNVTHLKFLLKALDWRERELIFNFYYSLARYQNGLPNQTMNMKNRNNDDWNLNHYKTMIGYDFLIDIDAGSHDDIYHAKDSMLMITDYFNRFNVPYYVKFSGKGFHIIIPHNATPVKSFDVNEKNNVYFEFSSVAKLLYERFSEMIDTKIYDPRRLCKLSYSLAVYEDDIFVCYPLHMRYDLENFNLDDYRLSKFDKSIQRRGMKLFNPDGDVTNYLVMKKNLKEGG